MSGGGFISIFSSPAEALKHLVARTSGSERQRTRGSDPRAQLDVSMPLSYRPSVCAVSILRPRIRRTRITRLLTRAFISIMHQTGLKRTCDSMVSHNAFHFSHQQQRWLLVKSPKSILAYLAYRKISFGLSIIHAFLCPPGFCTSMLATF